jgi:hypothetical protein
MAGAILILLFGDQFLDWRWLALAAVVTFPLAYLRTARRVPAPYRVAQIVDDRLALKDSLSTALYFSELSEPDRRSSEDMRRAQRAASERLVSQVDPKIAVPLTAPRMLYVFGSLFLTAAVLFGVRYGIQRRMDLARPLTSVLMDAFGGGSFARRAALNKNKKSSLDIWGQTQVDSMSGAETQYKWTSPRSTRGLPIKKAIPRTNPIRRAGRARRKARSRTSRPMQPRDRPAPRVAIPRADPSRAMRPASSRGTTREIRAWRPR